MVQGAIKPSCTTVFKPYLLKTQFITPSHPGLSVPNCLCHSDFPVNCVHIHSSTVKTVKLTFSRPGYRLATSWTVRGSNPGGDEIFRTRPDRTRGPPSLQYNGYHFSFPGVKRPGRGVDHPLSGAQVKERVQLYLYPRLGLQGLSQDEIFTSLWIFLTTGRHVVLTYVALSMTSFG